MPYFRVLCSGCKEKTLATGDFTAAQEKTKIEEARKGCKPKELVCECGHVATYNPSEFIPEN